MHKPCILYKFTPFINKSFKDTLCTFVDYIVDKYNVEKVVYNDTQLSPDRHRLGDIHGNFRPLDEVFVKLSFTSNSFKIISGYGTLFCTCYLNDYTKLEIHWDSIYNNYEDAIEFTHLMCRKLKLEKLNEKR